MLKTIFWNNTEYTTYYLQYCDFFMIWTWVQIHLCILVNVGSVYVEYV